MQDGDGVCKDWIELYNPGGEPVDLSGWSLSDDKDDPGRWVFPAGTVLQDYLVLFADGGDRQDAAGWHHTSFALRIRGETHGLQDAAGALRWTNSNTRSRTLTGSYGRAFRGGEDKAPWPRRGPARPTRRISGPAEREAALGRRVGLPAGAACGDTTSD